MRDCCNPCCTHVTVCCPPYSKAKPPPVDWDKISKPQPGQQQPPPPPPDDDASMRDGRGPDKRHPDETPSEQPDKRQRPNPEEEDEVIDFEPEPRVDPFDDPFGTEPNPNDPRQQPLPESDTEEDQWFDPIDEVETQEPTVQVEDVLSTDTEDEEVFTNRPAAASQQSYTYSVDNFTPPQIGGVPGIDNATALSQAVPSVDNQGPYGSNWVSPAAWAASDWDGVSTIDMGTMTTAAACAWLWPATGDVLRGTRQLYDSWGGFADETNPTPFEIQEWTLLYIQHFRTLTQNPTPLAIDRCLMLRALWSDERQHTTIWDGAYPGTCGSAAGPCVPCGSGGNPHCGAAFVPNSTDQEPYMLDTGGIIPACSAGASAEGIFTTNTDIPWSIKLSRVMNHWFCTGDSGHFGPFMGRELLGYHWLVWGAGTTWRGKWGGPLNGHPYTVPTDW